MGANGDGGVAAANLLLLDPDPRTRPGEPSRDRGRAMALQQYSLTKKWKGCVETKWKPCPGTRQKPAQSAAPALWWIAEKAKRETKHCSIYGCATHPVSSQLSRADNDLGTLRRGQVTGDAEQGKQPTTNTGSFDSGLQR